VHGDADEAHDGAVAGEGVGVVFDAVGEYAPDVDAYGADVGVAPAADGAAYAA